VASLVGSRNALDAIRGEMVRSLLDGRQWKPGLTFTDEEVGGLQHPIHLIYGSTDPVGSVDVWRRFVDLLPHGELEVVDSASMCRG
jgi:pimeloyl-ACP methyl ester carboxylesterase